MNPSARAVGRVMATIAGLTLTVALLVRLGDTLPSLPRSPADAIDQLGHVDPALLVFSLLRLAAIALGVYLLATMVAGTTVRLAHLPRATLVVDAFTVPIVAHLLRGVATAGMVVSLGGAIAAPAARAQTTVSASSVTTPHSGDSVTLAVNPPTIRWLPDEAPGLTTTEPETTLSPSTTSAPTDPPTTDPPTTGPPTTGPTTTGPTQPAPDRSPAPRPNDSTVELRLLDDPASPEPNPPAPPSPPASVPDPGPVASTPSAAPTPADFWVIAPGDHLWHVSVATLTALHGRPPTDAETVTYLHSLIALNREVFAVPGDPDLVFPGQQFRLPPA